MLFKRAILEGIARGDVTLAFRRWKRPTVKAGTRLRTALGEVPIGRVDAIEEAKLDDDAARRAGFSSLADLKESLRGDGGRQLYRIEIGGLKEDRRAALRASAAIDAKDREAIHERLRRWDKSAGRSDYHHRLLNLIAERPETAAAELAAVLGVEKLKFKRDVRKLKELGLTESLDVGYRISPRGRSFLSGNGGAKP
ncbi:ASCH domain-containing protein [uncultured Nitratireductor sp.]|uniref:ASCH domain-containing protein n=1 Tax=uncultured Nitratireductor sp. TaxID=520953 RepID=UPI0026012273|nr:ASCH domain-containing protein [uncultured Nitratireductor sp.]